MKLAYTFAEAAEQLGYKDRSVITRLVQSGELRAFRVTRRGDRRIGRDELKRFIEERTRNGA